MAIKVNFEIDLWVVGRADQHFRVHAPGSDLPGPLFSVGHVILNVGTTKKDEFTLGKDGTISLAGFQYFDSKKSLFKFLKDLKMNVNDFKRYYDWLRIVKIKDECKFTDAFINSIFEKTYSNDLWINTDWELNGS